MLKSHGYTRTLVNKYSPKCREAQQDCPASWQWALGPWSFTILLISFTKNVPVFCPKSLKLRALAVLVSYLQLLLSLVKIILISLTAPCSFFVGRLSIQLVLQLQSKTLPPIQMFKLSNPQAIESILYGLNTKFSCGVFMTVLQSF